MSGRRPIRIGRQRGVAAVTALLVVAIATVLAAELAWELHVDVQRTETMLLRNQAIQFALGAEMMAANGLRNDYETDNENGQYCDYEGEGWDQELTLPFEGGNIRGKITGLQGRFNLNNLLDPNGVKDEDSVELFGRLLEQVDLNPELAFKVVDWLDPDQLEELGGAEDGVYTAKIPPYRTANTWFRTTTELMAVDGFVDPSEPELDRFRLIERYVTALPGFQKINVNDADDAVLLALAQEGSPSSAEALKANRPYCDILAADGTQGAFMEDADGLISPDFANRYLDTGTNFFQLKVLVTLGTTQLTMYSLLYRDSNGVVTTKLRYLDTK